MDRLDERVARLEAGQRLLREYLARAFWGAMDRIDELTLPGRQLTCPICDRSDSREDLEKRVDTCKFGGGRLERYVCSGCGCIYGPAKYLDLEPELVDLDYRLLYDDYAEANSTEREMRVFRSLSPRRWTPYLNWGCGRWNQTIPTLREEGYDVWGYEPSAIPEDDRFVASTKEQVTGRFAGIFSNNVVEHMLDPIEDFRYLHEILLPGGRMAHASPCYRYDYSYTRFHVLFLTGDSVHVLATRTGFRVVERDEDGDFINTIFERV